LISWQISAWTFHLKAKQSKDFSVV
jgi:hypothetical protein